MFFLNNLYEKRFEHNMNKHRLDAKIAPAKPKPSCRLVPRENEQKHELVNRFMQSQELKEQVPVKIQQLPSSPPPTYQDSFFETKPQLANTDSQSSLFEKPSAFVDMKVIKRSASHESGFCTGGDSDVASQLSLHA